MKTIKTLFLFRIIDGHRYSIRSATYSACSPGWATSDKANEGYNYYQSGDYHHSTIRFDMGLGQEGYFKAGNMIKLFPGFRVNNGSKFCAFLCLCSGGIPGDSIKNKKRTGLKTGEENSK